MNSITLSELSERIQETIKLNFDTPVWIRAEISELRENPNGHCYLEFVEKILIPIFCSPNRKQQSGRRLTAC